MTEDELKAIEAELDKGTRHRESSWWEADIRALIAEVRQLRNELDAWERTT